VDHFNILVDSCHKNIFLNFGRTVTAKKNAHIENFVTELCQFLGGGWKVIIDVKQHSQPLLRVRNRGGELILSKKTPQLKWRGAKKGKKAVFEKFENL
jgi:hypothetical protein